MKREKSRRREKKDGADKMLHCKIAKPQMLHVEPEVGFDSGFTARIDGRDSAVETEASKTSKA